MNKSEPAVRRLRARQRYCRMAMRRAGLLALAGYTPPPTTDVQATWRRHGWEPSGKVAVVSIEIREAA